MINVHQIRGRLIERRGALREWWGTLHHNEDIVNAGRRDRAAGTIEYRHGDLRATIARQARYLTRRRLT